MRFYIILILFVGISTTVFSQSADYDSLFQVVDNYLDNSKPDEGVIILSNIIQNINTSKRTKTEAKIKLAEAYRLKKEFRKGEELLIFLLKNHEINDSDKAYIYNRLAAIIAENQHLPISRYHKVIEYSNKSLKISKKLKWEKLILLSLNEIGHAAFVFGDTALAHKNLRIALKGFRKQRDTLNFANTSINLSFLYSKYFHNYKAAKSILDSTLAFCNCNDHLNMKMRIFLKYADLYEKIYDYKKATYYYKQVRILQKEDFLNRMDKNINRIAASYGLQIKDFKLKQAQKEYHYKKNQNTFLIILSIVLISLVILLLVLFDLRKKVLKQKTALINTENEKLRLEIESKNKELISNALILSQNMASDVELVNKLENIYLIANEKTKNPLRKLIKYINSDRNKSAWEEFEIRFTQLHENFFKKLSKQAPELSPTEIKTCAFLKLNMNTKDIAVLTNRSIRTIENTRHSIRKKLKLGSDTNLVIFLLNL